MSCSFGGPGAAIIGRRPVVTALADCRRPRRQAHRQDHEGRPGKGGRGAAAACGLRRGLERGADQAAPLTAPNCPGFNPKESDLVVTGHADARYMFRRATSSSTRTSQVLKSAAAVQDGLRADDLAGGSAGASPAAEKLPSVTATSVDARRVPADRRRERRLPGRRSPSERQDERQLLSDYVFFGAGRIEYEFTVVAPPGREPAALRGSSAAGWPRSASSEPGELTA